MAAREKKIKELLHPLVESLQEAMGENLIAVVLFGSRARGKTTKASDWDIFVLAHLLPLSPMKRYAYLRGVCNDEVEEGVSFLAKTKEEFEAGFPSFYLDLALDGITLFDTSGYMEARLRRIRQIIQEAGLRRERIAVGFFWNWNKYPGPEWEISWKGFEVGK